MKRKNTNFTTKAGQEIFEGDTIFDRGAELGVVLWNEIRDCYLVQNMDNEKRWWPLKYLLDFNIIAREN
jgi:hypothetical protein